MENKVIKTIICTIILVFITSCNQKNYIKLNVPIEKKHLDTLSMPCDFIKRCSEKEIYLINPIDSGLICDINAIFYYREDNSRYIIVFNSSVFIGRYFIATVQDGKLDLYSCADLFKISEIHYTNKLIIEVYDSLFQFNTLSYGLHTLELLNKKKEISYHYTDTIF